MNKTLNKNSILRYSRQIILKNIGIVGQKKIKNSKILIVGMGGLGCPVADLLTRAGVGEIGIIEYDKINLSNIHRQTLFSTYDVGKFKVKIAKKKVKRPIGFRLDLVRSSFLDSWKIQIGEGTIF